MPEKLLLTVGELIVYLKNYDKNTRIYLDVNDSFHNLVASIENSSPLAHPKVIAFTNSLCHMFDSNKTGQ